MIDYAEIIKHLNKDKLCFEELQINASYSSGWDKYQLKGVNDLEVWHNQLYNFLKVKGSLPYYWQGHNFSFVQKDLISSLQDISERLKVNLWEAELAKFEFGTIIEAPVKPGELIRHHLQIPGKKTKSICQDLKIFSGDLQFLKLYDAGRNIKNKLNKGIRGLLSNEYGYDKDKHYLKVENHYIKPHKVLNNGIMILVNDLLIPDFYQHCKSDLLSQYQSIMKTKSNSIPTNKKALSAGGIILLAFEEAGKIFNINAEELINFKLKEIPSDILNQNDKKARKRQIKEMMKRLSGEGTQEIKEYDLTALIEAKLILEN